MEGVSLNFEDGALAAIATQALERGTDPPRRCPAAVSPRSRRRARPASNLRVPPLHCCMPQARAPEGCAPFWSGC